jgi:hypothetical protein
VGQHPISNVLQVGFNPRECPTTLVPKQASNVLKENDWGPIVSEIAKYANYLRVKNASIIVES